MTKRAAEWFGWSAEDVERLSCERDGWREIANDLARVAFGDGYETFELPPIEMIGRRDGQRGPITPLLKQWWTDLTREHGRLIGNKAEMAKLNEQDRFAVKMIRSILAGGSRVVSHDRSYNERGSYETTLVIRSTRGDIYRDD